MRAVLATRAILFAACAAALPLPGALGEESPLSWRAGRSSAHGDASTTPTAVRAVLIRNPDSDPGAPPFALADDRGRVQRLVEPSPSIRLEPHVGQIVRVRHDTGRTLLASQLDLPAIPPIALPATAPPTPVAPLQPIAASPTPSPMHTTAAPLVVLAPTHAGGVVPAQHTSGSLPPPVVLEEFLGESIGPGQPVADNLQFPADIQPGGPVTIGADGPHCEACGESRVKHGGRRLLAAPPCATCGQQRSGLDASIDLLLLRTHDSAAENGGDDFEFAPRLELGYGDRWGRRVALRYFDYDTGLATGSLDLETIDLEFQRQFKSAGGFAWGVGGGLRWAEYDETGGLAYSDTIGPLIGVYARGPAVGRIDGILTLRQSYQFGDAHLAGAPADRGTFGVTELQFGLEHRRKTRVGELAGQVLFETQYWDGVGRQGDVTGSRGLIGLGLGLGLTR